MKTKLYSLTLLVFLFLSPFICLASTEGGTDALALFLPLFLAALILMITGLVLPIISTFSKSAVVRRLSLITSSSLLVFAIIFITWGVDIFLNDTILYVSLLGFIIYLSKANKQNPVWTGILLGLCLLLIRLFLTEFGILQSYFVGLVLNALITGIFIFQHFKKLIEFDTINNSLSNHVGLKISLVSATFFFITNFYCYAAEHNLNNWFSFRNVNPVGILEGYHFLGFKEFLFIFFGTFVTVLVAGLIIAWGTKEWHLTKATTR